MMGVRRGAWLLWTGLSLAAGCGPADTSRPPSVRFGEEACAHCRMIISDERFAAARVSPSGEVLKFDDVGCLLKHEANETRPAAAHWVHDFRSPDWLDAREAIYVPSARVASPMGYDLVAVATTQAASDLMADSGGRTLRFGELAGFLAETRGKGQHPLPVPVAQ
jgi:copper chaperone NosL